MTSVVSRVVKESKVFKHGEGFMAGWKQRYLILYADELLKYFLIEGLELKGTINLANVSSAHDVQQSNKANKTGVTFGFYIKTKQKKYDFAIESYTERDEWIHKIRAVIHQSRTVSPNIIIDRRKYNSSTNMKVKKKKKQKIKKQITASLPVIRNDHLRSQSFAFSEYEFGGYGKAVHTQFQSLTMDNSPQKFMRTMNYNVRNPNFLNWNSTPNNTEISVSPAISPMYNKATTVNFPYACYFSTEDKLQTSDKNTRNQSAICTKTKNIAFLKTSEENISPKISQYQSLKNILYSTFSILHLFQILRFEFMRMTVHSEN